MNYLLLLTSNNVMMVIKYQINYENIIFCLYIQVIILYLITKYVSLQFYKMDFFIQKQEIQQNDTSPKYFDQVKSNSKLVKIKKIVQKIKKSSKKFNKQRYQTINHQQIEINKINRINKSFNKIQLDKTKQLIAQDNQYNRNKSVIIKRQYQPKNNHVFEQNYNQKYQQSTYNQSNNQKKKSLTTVKINPITLRNKERKNSSITFIKSGYSENLRLFNLIYECLNKIMWCLRHNKEGVIEQIQKYIKLIRNKKYIFIQKIIQQSNSKMKKQIFEARINEYISIITIIVQFITKGIIKNEVNLRNIIYHTIYNLIFISKIYITKNQFEQDPSNQYQTFVSNFLQYSFNNKSLNHFQLFQKMHHSNTLIKITIQKLNTKYFFYPKIKQYLKDLEFAPKIINSTYHYILQFLSHFLHLNKLVGTCYQFDVPHPPYLSLSNLKNMSRHYTIVIQPYGVLLQKRNQEIFFRQKIHEFLLELSKKANIIFWTKYMPNQIDHIIASINYVKIQKILYKYHCNYINRRFIKNIYMLGIDIRNVLIIDINTQVFSLTPKHGIQMQWNGEKNEHKLSILLLILDEIFRKNLATDQGLEMYEKEIKVCNKTYVIKKQNQIKLI